MDIKWTKLAYHDKTKVVYGTIYKRLKLVLMYSNSGIYCGLYCVNSPKLGSGVSRYHFYTNVYDDQEHVRSVCLFPNDYIYKIGNADKKIESVNEKLKVWFQNNVFIKENDFDVLGQEHGQFKDRVYKLMETGMYYVDAVEFVNSHKEEYKSEDTIKSLTTEVANKKFGSELLTDESVKKFFGESTNVNWDEILFSGK